MTLPTDMMGPAVCKRQDRHHARMAQPGLTSGRLEEDGVRFCHPWPPQSQVGMSAGPEAPSSQLQGGHPGHVPRRLCPAPRASPTPGAPARFTRLSGGGNVAREGKAVDTFIFTSN